MILTLKTFLNHRLVYSHSLLPAGLCSLVLIWLRLYLRSEPGSVAKLGDGAPSHNSRQTNWQTLCHLAKPRHYIIVSNVIAGLLGNIMNISKLISLLCSILGGLFTKVSQQVSGNLDYYLGQQLLQSKNFSPQLNLTPTWCQSYLCLFWHKSAIFI